MFILKFCASASRGLPWQGTPVCIEDSAGRGRRSTCDGSGWPTSMARTGGKRWWLKKLGGYASTTAHCTLRLWGSSVNGETIGVSIANGAPLHNRSQIAMASMSLLSCRWSDCFHSLGVRIGCYQTRRCDQLQHTTDLADVFHNMCFFRAVQECEIKTDILFRLGSINRHVPASDPFRKKNSPVLEFFEGCRCSAGCMSSQWFFVLVCTFGPRRIEDKIVSKHIPYTSLCAEPTNATRIKNFKTAVLIAFCLPRQVGSPLPCKCAFFQAYVPLVIGRSELVAEQQTAFHPASFSYGTPQISCWFRKKPLKWFCSECCDMNLISGTLAKHHAETTNLWHQCTGNFHWSISESNSVYGIACYSGQPPGFQCWHHG